MSDLTSSTTSTASVEPSTPTKILNSITDYFKDVPKMFKEGQLEPSRRKMVIGITVAIIIVIIIIIVSVTTSTFTSVDDFVFSKLLTGEDSYDIKIFFNKNDVLSGDKAMHIQNDIQKMVDDSANDPEGKRTDITLSINPIDMNDTTAAASLLMQYSLTPKDLPAIVINGSVYIGPQNIYAYKLRMRRKAKTSKFSATKKPRPVLPKLPIFSNKVHVKKNFNAVEGFSNYTCNLPNDPRCNSP